MTSANPLTTYDVPSQDSFSIASVVPSILRERLLTNKPLKYNTVEQRQAVVACIRVHKIEQQSAVLAAMQTVMPNKSAILSVVLNTLYGTLVDALSGSGTLITDMSINGLTALFLLESGTQAGRVHEALVSVEKAIENTAGRIPAGYPDIRWKPSAGIGIGVVSFAVIHNQSLNRNIFLTGGDALEQAQEALNLAEDGQLIAHRDVLKRLGSAPVGQWVKAQYFLSNESFSTGMVGTVLAMARRDTTSLVRTTPSLTPTQRETINTFLDPALHISFSELQQGIYTENMACLTLRVVGSSLSGEASVDRWQFILSKVQDMASRYGGLVQQITNRESFRTVNIVFGLFASTQDNIERNVVSCALALQRLLQSAEPTIRLGVASSHGFGALLGTSYASGYVAVGEAIAASAALVETAEAQEILVDAAIQAATEKDFTWQPLSPTKRKSDKIDAYVLAGEVTLGSGLMTRIQIARKTPVFGREKELEKLKTIVQKGIAGEGQTLIVSGESGHGRSTLIEVVIDQWLTAGGNGFIGIGPSYAPATPYSLWFPIWYSLFELQPEAGIAQNFDKLEAAVARFLPEFEDGVALFSDLLGLSATPSTEIVGLSPQARQFRLISAISKIFRQLSQVTPMLLAFENLDNVDTLSLELLIDLNDALEGNPVLFCIEDRADRQHSLQKTFSEAEVIKAKPLSGNNAWRLLNHFLPKVNWPYRYRKALEERIGLEKPPESTEDQAPEKADKKVAPSYVVALATVLQNTAAKRHGQRWEIVEKATPEEWPIDRIETTDVLLRKVLKSHEVQVAVRASMAGSLFYHQSPWLKTTPSADPTFEIRHLRSLHITEPYIDLGHGRRWDRFRHENIREALYLRLDSSQRATIHQQVYQWYRHHQPGAASMAAIAYHLQLAGNLFPAVEAYLVASKHAAVWGAQSEALQELLAAERILAPQNQDSPQTKKALMKVYLARTELWLHSGFNAKGIIDVNRALALAEQLDASSEAARGLILRTRFKLLAQEFHEAEQDSERAVELAQTVEDHEALAQALWLQARALFAIGKRHQASQILIRSINSGAVQDPVIRIEMELDAARILLGDYQRDRAYEHIQHAHQQAEKLGDPIILKQTLMLIGHLNVLYGESEKAVEALEKAIGLPSPTDASLSILGNLLIDHATALCYMGRYTDAEAIFETAISYFMAENDSDNVLRANLIRASELFLDRLVMDQAQAAIQEGKSQNGQLDIRLQHLIDLTEVAILIYEENFDNAEAILKELDATTDSPTKHWYAPLRYLRWAELALAKGNLEVAAAHAVKSLGAVSMQGDLRFLTATYTLLAETMILRAEKNDAILDALNRAVLTGRCQGRQIHLGRALYMHGEYLRHASLRRTARAEGSTYLFESNLIFKEMNLSLTDYIPKKLLDRWNSSDNGKSP